MSVRLELGEWKLQQQQHQHRQAGEEDWSGVIFVPWQRRDGFEGTDPRRQSHHVIIAPHAAPHLFSSLALASRTVDSCSAESARDSGVLR